MGRLDKVDLTLTLSREEEARRLAAAQTRLLMLRLALDGMILVKFWLHISHAEQLRRFRRRERDPLKSWKLTEDDWRNRKQRAGYEAAVEDMLERTDQPLARWHVVEAESKRYARVKVVETTIAEVEAGMRARG